MSKLSDFEKRIYNCYLKNFRKGEPYRPRKDFSDVNPNVVLSLVKLSAFFNSYPHINMEEFFEAPNSLYKDDKYPALKSFIGRAAIKNYSLYQKQKEDRNPELQFDYNRDSFKFIGLFCVNNKIKISDYLSHKTGYMYSWLNHYREHRVNPYALFAIGDVIAAINRIPKDERDLFALNLEQNLLAYYNRFDKSPKTKQYTNELFKKVKTFIEKELTTTQNMLN